MLWGINFCTKSVLPIWKTIVYTFLGIIFISVTLGFLQDFITDSPHILEGKFGYWTNQLLKAQIGSTGVAGLLIFAYLTALIVIYNFDLKLTWFPRKEIPEEDLEDHAEDNFESFTRVNAQNRSFDRTTSPDRTIEEEDIISNTAEAQHNLIKAPFQEELSAITPEAEEEEEANEEELNFSFSISAPESDATSIPLSIDPAVEIPEEEEDLSLAVEDIIEEKAITSDDLVAQFGEYDPKLDLSGYKYPTLDLLKDYGAGKITINQQELEANKNRIVETLRNYNIEIEHIKATIGPTVTLYEIIPKPGVRISRIKNLEDDIALSLAALGIRIIAPMPGKGTIGIEVPNSSPEMVSMRSVLATEKFQKTDMDLPIALGKTISNEVFIADLAKMPHLLVAGATGQGKSVGINAILTSLLYKKHPAELKFVMVDPKKVELSLFKKN